MTSARTWISLWPRTPAWLAMLIVALVPTSPQADSLSVRSLPPPAARQWQTGMLRADRLQHASLAWTLGLGVGLASREPVAAVTVPAVLGLVKEVADARGPGFDRLDLLADLLGAAAAGWVTARWR
ncbi:MAG: hypothetical protein ABIS67_10905 [Candidatus Eisenbacteria bacterium]